MNGRFRESLERGLPPCATLSVCLGLILVSVAARAADASPVGVVDLEQAFQRSPAVMALAVRVGAEFEPRRRALNQRIAGLARLRDRAQAAPADERVELEERVRAEALAVAGVQAKLRRDMEAAQKEYGEEFMARVAEVAADVAREKGLSILVRKGGVLWTRPADPASVDITEDVIRTILLKVEQAPSGASLPTH